jgi:hypothetical protein
MIALFAGRGKVGLLVRAPARPENRFFQRLGKSRFRQISALAASLWTTIL